MPRARRLPSIFDGAPYGPQPSYWLTTLGSGYVDQAFLWAHAADPSAKLFYNDTGGEGLGAKSDAVYNLVRGLVSRGIPIHGVGLQMHVTLAPPSVADISANIQRLGALGLEVHITEMDVRLAVPASAGDLAAQAAVYRNVLSACQANSHCTALLTWGVSDANSWIPGFYPGFGAALLFDQQYRPKPAYSAFATQLGAPGSPAWTIVKKHSGNFTQGQDGATYSITVTNSGTVPTTSAPAVQVLDSLPTGLSIVSISGPSWNCSTGAPSICSRSDPLNAGASYPPITVTVNVASDAPASVTNQASMSGGGAQATAAASDPTTILPAGIGRRRRPR